MTGWPKKETGKVTQKGNARSKGLEVWGDGEGGT